MTAPFCIQCGQVMRLIHPIKLGIHSFLCANCGFQLNIHIPNQDPTSSQFVPLDYQRLISHPIHKSNIQHIGDKIQRAKQHPSDNNPLVFTTHNIGDFKWLLSEAFRDNLNLFENSPMTGGQLLELMTETNLGLLRRLYNSFDFQLTENYFK